VLSAMRQSQPNALTLLISSYPDVQRAMGAILLEADEIIVSDLKPGDLLNLLARKCRPAR